MHHLHRHKSIIAIFCLFFSVVNHGIAQRPKFDELRERRPMHFGVTFVGAATKMRVLTAPDMLTRDSVSSISPLGYPGVGFGGVWGIRINERWETRLLASLHILERGFEYKFKDGHIDKIDIETVSFDIPLLVKYKSSRHGDNRFFIIGGVRYTHDFQSNEKAVRSPSLPLVALKADQYYYEFGFGFEFFLQFVNFCPEIKMSNGINNILSKDPHIWASSISKIYPRIFSISFNFEY